MKKGTLMLIVGAIAGIFAYRYFVKGGTVKAAIDTVASKVKEVTTGVPTVTETNIANTPTTNGAALSNNVDTTGTIITPEAPPTTVVLANGQVVTVV